MTNVFSIPFYFQLFFNFYISFLDAVGWGSEDKCIFLEYIEKGSLTVVNNSDISSCQCDSSRKMNGKKQTQCISTVAGIDDDKCRKKLVTPQVLGTGPSVITLSNTGTA